jgi:hypothetical protein
MEPFFFTLPKMEEKSEQQAPNQFFGNLSNKDFIPKKKVKIVRSAMLFCDILKKDFFLRYSKLLYESRYLIFLFI